MPVNHFQCNYHYQQNAYQEGTKLEEFDDVINNAI